MVKEFRLKVFLLKDIPIKEGVETISKLLDTCLVTSGCSALHKETQTKLYCFSSFYPLAEKGQYKAGNIYTVVIRTMDQVTAEVFERNLDKQSTSYIKALTLEKRMLKQKHVDEIFSLTPVIVKFRESEGYWRGQHSMEAFENHLKTNLIKKYNMLHHECIDENFEWINYIKILNNKPIATKYKDIQLLGDKVSIKIAEHPNAQALAWMAIGTGLGEMAGRGFGFVNYRYL